MKILGPASILAAALLALSASTVTGQTDPSKPMQYKLEPPSAFETGCFNMCACPIVMHPLKGTFTLEHTGFDPLFDNYRVADVRWVVTDATTYFTITGSGTYRIGGEFALQHQLVLDLSLDGGAPLRFDSGLIVTDNRFPNIVIDVRRNGGRCHGIRIVEGAVPGHGTESLRIRDGGPPDAAPSRHRPGRDL